MLLIVIVGGIILLTALSLLRRRARRRGSAAAPPQHPAAIPQAAPGAAVVMAPLPAPGRSGAIDLERVNSAAQLSAQRLWKLAFATPSQGQTSDLVNRRVRDNVTAMLQVDSPDEKYFPRRPTLLPQLMQAVNDPAAASDKVSRIIAHDPVLTAAVLRLANSSLHRTSPGPVETIQRALVVCGTDALRGMLAAALLQPAFRATRKNFPRLPRMLWERTERATHAAEAYALQTAPQDRFEAQLVVLLSALGPLVVYSAAIDVYARNPHFAPNGDLCVALIDELSPQVSRHIARAWQTSPRLVAALEGSAAEPLTLALQVGELLGTLRYLESQTVISGDQRRAITAAAGLHDELP